MSDRVKIGPKVDKQLWERFREDIKARKGKVRGSLGDELENAIREYLKDGPTEQEERILEKLSRIERTVGAAPADGGGDTMDGGSYTHAPSRVDAAKHEKPAANAATEKKVAYLAERVLDREAPDSREITQVPREHIVEVVKSEYGFRSDTAKRYVEELTGYFELREHPTAGNLLVSEREFERIVGSEEDDSSEV